MFSRIVLGNQVNLNYDNVSGFFVVVFFNVFFCIHCVHVFSPVSVCYFYPKRSFKGNPSVGQIIIKLKLESKTEKILLTP